jgi:hypothetical protein
MRALGASRTSVVPGGVLAGNWARDPLWKNARAVPSLDLRFAENKSLTDAKTGASLVTFTRASTGTYVGSDGLIKTATTDEARFDHNPTTGESLGLLVEEARTNLILQSNQFNTTWTNSDTSETSAAGIAPDGTNTAWELKDSLDLVPTIHGLTQAVNYVSGTSYTFTCWMKVGTLTQGGFAFPAAAFTTALSCRVDLLTGSVITSSSGLSTSTTLYANGWVRIISVATATATVASSITIRILNNANSYIGTGDGTILIWGAQLEAGASPTSYIPTTTATVTRAADVASITETNFSSWYNQTEGTIYASYAERAFSVTHQVVTFSNGTANERISFAVNASNILDVGVISGGTDTFTGNTPTLTAQEYQIGFGYKADNSGVSANGSAITIDSAVILPTVSQLDIGARGSSQILNSTIKRITYWPVRLADSTLVSITAP